MAFVIRIPNMNLMQIAESGQCFRWKRLDDNKYLIPAIGPRSLESRDLIISEEKEEFTLNCDEDDWNRIWKDYFDYETDYPSIGDRILASGDEHAIEAYLAGKGIRILRQDLWEVIVSFIISQNNNIKRIRASIEAICELNDGYFPYPGDIDTSVFYDKTLGLGYRSPYLVAIYEYASQNPDWLNDIRMLSYGDAFNKLKERTGIGPKVANCICLFGLHQIDAFPIDTHVKQLIDKYYSKGFDFDYFEGIAGVVQQYLFYYELKH